LYKITPYIRKSKKIRPKNLIREDAVAATGEGDFGGD